MKKVTVLRLGGCKYCEELVDELGRRGINYKSIDANENGALADKVEALIKTDTYPIVILEISGLPTLFLFRAQTSDELGEFMVDGGKKMGVVDVNSMVNIISKLI